MARARGTRLLGPNWNRYSVHGILFVLPAVVYFLAVFFYPLVLALWNSFNRVNLISKESTWVGLRNYLKLLRSEELGSSVKITVLYVLLTVPATFVLSLLLSVTVAGMRRGAFLLFSTLFFLPFVTSAVSAGMIWGWVLDPNFGIVNTVLRALGMRRNVLWLRSMKTALVSVAIIAVWMRLGFDILIFTSGLLGISPSYYEAARIEGASEAQRFFLITLPFLNPQMVMVLMLELIFAFRAFGTINVTTEGGPGGATKTLMIYLMKDLFHYDFGAASALTVLVMVFLISISVLQRVFLRRVVQY
jgi:multiple sugar transport system permease protein